MNAIGRWLLMAAVLFSTGAGATTFCVSTPAQIASAMTTAAGNAQNDDIRIVAGNYALTQTLMMWDAEARQTSISGGWNGACSARTGTTTLNGEMQVQIMFLLSSVGAAFTVNDLVFESGKIANQHSDAGAGLYLQTEGAAIVANNRFLFNSNDYDVGAVLVAAAATVVRNNVIAFNSTGWAGAVEVVSNGSTAYVTGNSVLDNSCSDPNGTSGIDLSGSSAFKVSNNVFWSAGGVDVFNNATLATFLHNDLDSYQGNGWDAATSAGNFDKPPHAVGGFFAVRQASDSPLINAGFDTPPGGIGTQDAGGDARLQGPHVDIGAYESDVLFYDGFDDTP